MINLDLRVWKTDVFFPFLNNSNHLTDFKMKKKEWINEHGTYNAPWYLQYHILEKPLWVLTTILRKQFWVRLAFYAFIFSLERSHLLAINCLSFALMSGWFLITFWI